MSQQDKQTNPRPTQAPAQPVTPTKDEPTVAPPSSVTFKDGRIELVRPVLELMGHVFVDPSDHRTQSKKLEPQRAYIADGLVVIEEWGIWFPVGNVSIGRKAK